MYHVEITAGLRIDVDTLRGTRQGVPVLLDILKKHGITATFFFSVGPDNMGRHLRRLLRPAFCIKMMRSKAASLYGWDILLRGTLWPGPNIGRSCDAIIRSAAQAGHEIGLHAWDHHLWQMQVSTMSSAAIRSELKKGKEELETIIGQPVTCSAVPGWRCTDTVLAEKEALGFHYNSDCRGSSPFYPKVKGNRLSQPQVPVTMPTYDELIGRNGISETTYNEYLVSLFRPNQLNVLTIHAEVEGISCQPLFEDFLKQAQARNVSFTPLKDVLTGFSPLEESSTIVRGEIAGREGWISCQHHSEEKSNDN
jgi:undecaprenyl phosphate-alpha-L-ara4FN deformylase